MNRFTDDDLAQLEEQASIGTPTGTDKLILRLVPELRELRNRVKEQQIYINELRMQCGIAAHDFEPEVD